MKQLVLALFVMISATQAHAKAYQLVCSDLNAKSGEAPFLTATIVSDTTLRDVKVTGNDFNGIKNEKTDLATGTMVVSQHSPYKGDIRYALNNNLVLLLPPSLADQDLESALESGIGYQKNENGVVIGTSEESDAGNHFSIRLNCSSDK